MTRDNLLFSWLAVIVAIAGYLATGTSPTTWDFQHWMQAVIAVGGIIAAKLGTSPLQGSVDKALAELKAEVRPPPSLGR